MRLDNNNIFLKIFLKIYRVIKKIARLFCLIIALPFALVIIFLSSLITLRFYKLDTERIGHFSSEIEQYLNYEYRSNSYKRKIDIFYHKPTVVNHQLLKIIREKIFVIPFPKITWFIDLICSVLDKVPGGKKHVLQLSKQVVPANLIHPHFSLNDDDTELAKGELKNIGVPVCVPFVCIYGRDSAYLKAKYPNYNWDYHQVRDNDIYNYLSAAETLTSKGYYVFRMGNLVSKPLQSSNPMIIDYASSSYRSELLDIYLSANCRFFLGVPGGLVAIPVMFRRPIGYIDMVNVWNIYDWAHFNGVFIIKKIWLIKEKRFLKFKEMIDNSLSQKKIFSEMQSGTIEVINNSAEEIFDLSEEIDLRVSNKWKKCEEDESLQNRFKSLFKENKNINELNITIGSKYLKQNSQLL